MKKYFKKFIACMVTMTMTAGSLLSHVTVQAASNEADITSGLIGYYTFDGSLENIVSSTGGKASLHSGAGDNTWSSPATGKANYEDSKEGFGKAYHFLGDNGTARGEGLQLDAKVSGTDFTVSFWVNPENYATGTTSLVFANYGDSCFSVNSLNGFRCSALLGKLWDFDNRGNTFVCLDGDIAENGMADLGKWTMVTITNKNKEQKLYFNGVEKVQGNNTSSNTLVTNVLKNQEIFLGINWWDPSFKGLMDEVRIYDRALTAADISALYAYEPKTEEILVTGMEIIDTGSGIITTSITYATEADKNADNVQSAKYGTYQYDAKTIPENAMDKTYTWSIVSSSTANEATISTAGLVTLTAAAKNDDKITVRATSNADPSIYAEKVLTVAVNEIIADTVKEITDDNVSNYYQPVDKSRVSVHDPAIVKENGVYYIFGSHLAWAKSTDLIHWTTFSNNISKDYKNLFTKEFAWAAIGDSKYDPAGNMWAPDVIWNKSLKKWCMYMSINGNSWNSSICLLTADHLDGDWTYKGTVVYSGFGKDAHDYTLTDYTAVTGKPELDSNSKYLSGNSWTYRYGAHAIDACVFYDEKGKLWFTYGSWSGGIYMFELDETTGYRLNTTEAKAGYTDEYMGKKIGGSTASGEASYIEYIDGYYYLFLSYGGFVANGGYNMRVFRSKNPDGPYQDVSGNFAIEGGGTNGSVGTRIMSYYKWSWWEYAHVAQGHNSAFVDDDGKAYVIYHTRTNDGTEGHSVRVHQLFTSENHYLLSAPFEYNKSDTVNTSGYSNDEIAGTYEILFQKNTNNTALEYNKPQVITLTEKGDITGDVKGTWTSKTGSPFVTFTINKINYEGILLEQTMEGSNVKTLCFTTVGTDDICLWGAKYPDDRTAVAWASSNINIPSTTYSNLDLKTSGLFGTTITWKSDDTTILGNDGTMTEVAGTVTLTATIRKGDCFRVMKKEVSTKPKDASGKTLVAEYFKGNATDLTSGIQEGHYRYENPFHKSNIFGLDMDNGVSISFDYERNGEDIAKLGAILAFRVKGNNDPKMFLTDGTYFGYNAFDGNFFDVNNSLDTMKDFIGSGKKHIELILEPTGVTLNIDGVKAYDVADFNNKTLSTNINETGKVNYSSMLQWLNETADELDFGWGSFWTAPADAVKAKISNVKFYVLPTETIDTSVYEYYENYNKTYDISSKWTIERAGGTIGNDNDSYRNYVNIAMDSGVSANGSAATDFGDAVAELDEYVVEVDAALRSGNVAQRSQSQFAIIGTDCNAKVDPNTQLVNSGYILKLQTKDIEGEAGKGAANTTDWYINGTDAKVTLPLSQKEPQWVHIKATVNRSTKKADIVITSQGTELYRGQVDINGTGALKGLYTVIGRGNGLTRVDNIAVYKSGGELESISLNYADLELAVGGSQTLLVSKNPAYAETGKVSWESDDTSIATVDANGKVTGVSKGTAIVTATLDGKTASCTVIVGGADKDTIPPTGTIEIAENKWDSFLSQITFGLYKTSQEVITITAEDNEELAGISYLIATGGKTYSLGVLKTLPDTDWTEYNNSSKPKLVKDTKNVVYAKLEDAAGNVAYLSSDGIIEDETAPSITMFETVTGSLTDKNVSFYAETNEDGTYYFAIYKDSEDKLKNTNFASKVIEKPMQTGKITKDNAVTISKTGLEKLTVYNAYLVVQDTAGNISTRQQQIETLQEIIEVKNAVITGEPVYGEMLLANATNDEGVQHYAYQWMRSSKPITENTNIADLILIGKTFKGIYRLGKEDLGKYIAVVIALSDEYYAGSAIAYTSKVTQQRELKASAIVDDKDYDKTTDAEIPKIVLDGIMFGDDVKATAEQADFLDANAGPNKTVLVSGLTLSGEDAKYYRLEQTEIETTATIHKSTHTPNLPNTSRVWSVSQKIKTVGEVALPEGWIWREQDVKTVLPIAVEVTACAIYNGEDKGNYEVETVEIKLTRSNCNHDDTELKGVVEATCTKPGYSGDRYCLNEDCKELVSMGGSISPRGHTKVEDERVEATCTEAGKTKGFHCLDCGEVLTAQEIIPALGHTEEIDEEMEATCTEAGKTEGTHCLVCGEVLTAQEIIPALGHSKVVDKGLEASCTEEGKTEGFHCSICGKILVAQEKIPMLEHEYIGTVTKEPTTEADGEKTFVCSLCGDSYTEKIDKLPAEDHEHEHKYTVTTTVATCTQAGIKASVCGCGERVEESIPALGHDHVGTVTKPATYSETGIRTFTCSRCDDSYTEEIPRLISVQTPSTSITTPSNGSAIGTTTTPPSETTEDNANPNPVVTEPSENSDSVVETKPDGTKVETVTEKQPDGTVKETITETKPDGTVKDTVTEKKTDGTVVSTIKDTKADGSVIETKEITVADNSATLATTVETSASGKTAVNSVIRTGVSNSSDTVSISESLLNEVATDSRVNSVVIEITDVTVKSAATESKQTVVNVQIPVVDGVTVEKVVLTKESIDTAKETGKGLKVNVVSSTKDSILDNYSVTIPAKQLAKIDASVEGINVTINADRVTNVADNSIKNTVTKVLNKNNAKKKETCVVSLAANEAVNAGMKVTIPVTDKTSIAKGSKVFVYKYDAKTGKLIETANCKQIVSSDGSVVIAASSGSDYVISAKKLSGSKVETIKDSISVSVSKKTAKVGKVISVNVSLPETVSTKSAFGTEKATITYKSSDSKIASVSKAGAVTTKKKGTVTVTTTVKLSSGQKVTKEQKITVK